jgi:phospholipid/cholesterol/gamma-HCH transport system substrate-binding protein
MPTAQKVSWAQLKVGIMAVVAMAILGVLIFLLTGDTKLFAKEEVIYTYMDDSAALAKGAPVRLNGILAGKVKDVTLSGERQPQRVIKIAMEIDKKMLPLIPVDSVAAISAENVLGTKYINIKKGQSTVPVQPGAEIKSLDTREFDEVVQQGYSLLTSLQGILKRVDTIVGLVEVGQGSIGKLLVDETLYNKILAVVSEGQKITAALSTNKGTIGKLIYDDTLYTDVRGSLARVDGLLADLQQGKGTAGKLLNDDALYTDLRKSIAEVNTLVGDLNAGKGSAGKLLKSEDLHNQLKVSMGKVDLLLDKINAGQGTLGQLLVNPQLYDSMNGATRELNGLFKDFRANPKKFLHVKLSLF